MPLMTRILIGIKDSPDFENEAVQMDHLLYLPRVGDFYTYDNIFAYEDGTDDELETRTRVARVEHRFTSAPLRGLNESEGFVHSIFIYLEKLPE